ncbi:MAG: Ig-like domain-containing protein, partial [Blastocatellia bacterium]
TGMMVRVCAFMVCGLALSGFLTGRPQKGIFAHRTSPASGRVAIVSAASFEEFIAPESIVAAFGEALATETRVAATIPLPTELAGTTVTVKDGAGVERLAPLFFVSPGQVNFMVPEGTAIGPAGVKIQSGERASTGEMRVNTLAPAIFSANGNGKDVAAAILLRIRPDGTLIYENVANCDPRPCVAIPLKLETGPAGERHFLLLYGSGMHQATMEDLRLLLGGEVVNSAVAPVQGLAGLDQINVELSRALIGRGVVSLSVSAPGFSTSNQVKIEFAPPKDAMNPPIVVAFDRIEALARQTLMIQGEYFDPEREKNLVIIGGKETREIETASPTRLSVKVPFGAASGKVAVRTARGQGTSANDLMMRTAISGYVENTLGQALPGMLVQVPADTVLSATTDKEGAFVLPNVPAVSPLVIEIMPPPAPAPLPFTKTAFRWDVLANRDNHVGHRQLQQIQPTGQNALSFGSSGAPSTLAPGARARTRAAAASLARTIQDGGITFEIVDNAIAGFPGGGTSGILFLNRVENSRTPVELPPGVFSSTIAQLTPFRVKLTPGGRLIFPNNDGLPANSQPRLYRFDQTPNSPTLGAFVDAGPTMVTSDGRFIETLPAAITETSIFLAAVPQPAITVIGRVVDSDGVSPVRGAIARVNGQQATTDGNGGFTLRNVPVSSTTIIVEASFQHPSGRVDHIQSNPIPAPPNTVINAGNLRLPPPPFNRPPVVVAPPRLNITEGLALNATVLAYDQDAGQTLQVNLTGPGFASLAAGGGSAYTLRIAPQPGDARMYGLTITATDSTGAAASQSIQLTVNINQAPTVVAPGLRFATPGQLLNFTVSATDPDNTPPGLATPQTFTFTSPNLPSGGRLISQDGMNAVFDWTPNATGLATPGFIARDNGAPPLNSESKSTRILVGTPWARTSTMPAGGIEAAQTFALLHADPNLFAATSGGVFLSTNQGLNWAPRNSGLTTLHVNTLALSGGTLLAGTNGGGVFRSTDNGQNWASCGSLPDGVVRTLAVSSRGLFAGTFGGGVFLSTDGCEKWTPINSGLTNRKINALAVSGSTVYAGTEGGGAFRLRENEQDWEPAGLANLKVRSIASSGPSLIAGAESNGIYCSTDQGQSWPACASGLTNPKTTVNALVVNGADVFACTSGDGVFRSINQGASWAPLPTDGLKNLFVASFAVGNSNLYLAGTSGGGVFSLSNQSQTWAMANTGLASSTVNALLLNGAALFAGTAGGGVFRSDNQGQTWTANNNGLPAPYVNAFALSGGTLFASTNDGVFSTPASANPLNWTRKSNGLPVAARYAIPLITMGSSLFVGIAPGGGIYRSDDLGENWRAVNNGFAEPDLDLQSLAALDSTLFAGTENSGIFRSTNGGQSWTRANTGLTGLRVHALAAAGTTVYAGTDNGVFRSDNQGQSWTPVSVGLPDRAFVNALLVNVAGSYLFAGIFGGVYFSNDQGQNWAPANPGLTHNNVFALVHGAQNVFAGTIGGGVYGNSSPQWTTP